MHHIGNTSAYASMVVGVPENRANGGRILGNTIPPDEEFSCLRPTSCKICGLEISNCKE